jgi:hypothetical protein
VRMLDGSQQLVFGQFGQPALVTSLSTDRVAWQATLTAPGAAGRTVLCTLDDAGEPVVVFEGLSVIASPVGPLTLTSSLQSGNTQFGDYSRDINDQGDIAMISLATNAAGQTRSVVLTARPAPASCGDVDFNNDAVFPDELDILDFFTVLAGGPCPTFRCDTPDFNRNGVFPEDADVLAFFNVLAGGGCEN